MDDLGLHINNHIPILTVYVFLYQIFQYEDEHHPFMVDSAYHPVRVVNLGMVYGCFTHICGVIFMLQNVL